MIGTNSDDVVVSGQWVTLRFDLVRACAFSQVSSLHPSNDYKTVSTGMYASGD